MRRDPTATGIYVHFPYCIQKCHYCDFYSVGMDRLPELAAPADANSTHRPRTTVPDPQLAAFFRNLTTEFEQRLKAGESGAGFRRFEKINTIFFGGGTASLMPPELIERILALFRREFTFTSDVEITVEGNPENFSADYLAGLHQLGVNRVNVGLQTFREDLLASMHRYYDPGQYETVLENLAAAKINRIGADLIYGFPEQSADEFYADLKRTVSAGVNHLSVYSLTLEPNTTYAGHVHTGRMRAPGEELQERIFQELPATLARQGLEQYEVSNFARPGFACRHNLRYWLYETYMGLGPGAHGFDGRFRYGNTRSIAGWQKDPAGAAFDAHDPLQEFPLVYLRLCDTLMLKDFSDALVAEAGFPESILSSVATIFEDWRAAGYVERADGAGEKADGVRWTGAGLLQLDDRIVEMCAALEAAAAIL